MASATVKLPVLQLGPRSNGVVLTPLEFDRAGFEDGYHYELINGVLVVSPPALENQRDPNEELGHWLRNYQVVHPKGSTLDLTLPEHSVKTGRNRRNADRAIWTGLGRLPRRRDVPTIVVEFVSAGKRNIQRDYETKRDEYLRCGVREYWVFDRFAHTLTVFRPHGRRFRKQVVQGHETYTTDLLPGFELRLRSLFELADRWPEAEEDDA